MLAARTEVALMETEPPPPSPSIPTPPWDASTDWTLILTPPLPTKLLLWARMPPFTAPVAVIETGPLAPIPGNGALLTAEIASPGPPDVNGPVTLTRKNPPAVMDSPALPIVALVAEID